MLRTAPDTRARSLPGSVWSRAGCARPGPSPRDTFLPRDKQRRPALRCELSQRAPIFDWHHLAEFWQIGLPVLKNAPCASRTSVARVVDDQLMQALSVESAHVTHHVDSAVGLEIAPGMQMALHDLFLGSARIAP